MSKAVLVALVVLAVVTAAAFTRPEAPRRAPPPRPNPHLDVVERRGVAGEGSVVLVAIAVLGVGLIVAILGGVRL